MILLSVLVFAFSSCGASKFWSLSFFWLILPTSAMRMFLNRSWSFSLESLLVLSLDRFWSSSILFIFWFKIWISVLFLPIEFGPFLMSIWSFNFCWRAYLWALLLPSRYSRTSLIGRPEKFHSLMSLILFKFYGCPFLLRASKGASWYCLFGETPIWRPRRPYLLSVGFGKRKLFGLWVGVSFWFAVVEFGFDDELFIFWKDEFCFWLELILEALMLVECFIFAFLESSRLPAFLVFLFSMGVWGFSKNRLS